MFIVQRHFWVKGVPHTDEHTCACDTLASAKYRAEWLAEAFDGDSCFYVTCEGVKVAVLNIFGYGRSVRFAWS